MGIVVHDWLPVAAPILFGLSFFTLLNAAVAREARGGWFNHRFARWLAGVGIWSYSLYLVHNLARIVVKQIVGPQVPSDSWMAYWAIAVLTALAGYASGRLYFGLVESRFLSPRPSESRHQPASSGNPLRPVAHPSP
jgi:peptidoglycan/LPS O-acetylase OafA/YrhL